MTLEIQVLDKNRHKHVEGQKWLMGSQPRTITKRNDNINMDSTIAGSIIAAEPQLFMVLFVCLLTYGGPQMVHHIIKKKKNIKSYGSSARSIKASLPIYDNGYVFFKNKIPSIVENKIFSFQNIFAAIYAIFQHLRNNI